MLSDLVEQALESIGVTSKRVSGWLGAPCGCPERKEKMDELERWARRVVRGKLLNAYKYLEEIIQTERKPE